MTAPVPPEAVEALCEVMHDAYEAAAVEAGWETQQRSRKPWADVPEANKATMRVAVVAVVAALDLPARDRETAAKALEDAADADDWDSALGRANVRVRLRARATALREGREP